MASGHPLAERQSILAIATETTAGTAIAAGSLVTGDTAINAFGISIEPDQEPNEREAPGSFSPMPSRPGADGCTVRFSTYLANSGSGTPPIWFSRLLAAAGYGISGGTATPDPGSASATTLTVGYFQDGYLEIASGCMFDFQINYTSGRMVRVDWTGRGIYAQEDETLITLTGETALPPKFQAATVTFAGTGYVTPEVVFRAGNDVQLREDGTTASGYKSAVIVNCNPQADVLVERPLVATVDWSGAAVSATEYAFVCAVGSGSNGIVTLNGAKAQLRSRPVKELRNNIPYWRLPLGFNRSAAAGNDHNTIVLS